MILQTVSGPHDDCGNLCPHYVGIGCHRQPKEPFLLDGYEDGYAAGWSDALVWAFAGVPA